MTSTLGDHLSVITSKLYGTKFDLFPSLNALKEIYHPSAWLICSHNGAQLWFLPAAPEVPRGSQTKIIGSWKSIPGSKFSSRRRQLLADVIFSYNGLNQLKTLEEWFSNFLDNFGLPSFISEVNGRTRTNLSSLLGLFMLFLRDLLHKSKLRDQTVVYLQHQSYRSCCRMMGPANLQN